MKRTMADRIIARVVRILTMELPNPFMPIHWDEPYAFTRMKVKLELEAAPLTPGRCAKLILGILGLSGLFMLTWLLARLPPRPESDREPMSFAVALLVSVAGGLTLMCISCLVYLFAPRTIGLSRKGLICIRGNSQRRWSYDKIASIRFDTPRFAEKDFTVMFVDLRDGKDLAFGVSKKMDIVRLADFLRCKGVSVAPETPQSQEQE